MVEPQAYHQEPEEDFAYEAEHPDDSWLNDQLKRTPKQSSPMAGREA